MVDFLTRIRGVILHNKSGVRLEEQSLAPKEAYSNAGTWNRMTPL